MGDNRDFSRDSRAVGAVGYVPWINLVGRAEVIFLSVDGPTLAVWDWYRTLRISRIFQAIR
jgi:signal peptidase I